MDHGAASRALGQLVTGPRLGTGAESELSRLRDRTRALESELEDARSAIKASFGKELRSIERVFEMRKVMHRIRDDVESCIAWSTKLRLGGACIHGADKGKHCEICMAEFGRLQGPHVQEPDGLEVGEMLFRSLSALKRRKVADTAGKDLGLSSSVLYQHLDRINTTLKDLDQLLKERSEEYKYLLEIFDELCKVTPGAKHALKRENAKEKRSQQYGQENDSPRDDRKITEVKKRKVLNKEISIQPPGSSSSNSDLIKQRQTELDQKKLGSPVPISGDISHDSISIGHDQASSNRCRTNKSIPRVHIISMDFGIFPLSFAVFNPAHFDGDKKAGKYHVELALGPRKKRIRIFPATRLNAVKRAATQALSSVMNRPLEIVNVQQRTNDNQLIRRADSDTIEMLARDAGPEGAEINLYAEVQPDSTKPAREQKRSLLESSMQMMTQRAQWAQQLKEEININICLPPAVEAAFKSGMTDLSALHLSSADVSMVLPLLFAADTKLRSLDLSMNKISECRTRIAKALPCFSSLREIDLSGTDQPPSALADCINALPSQLTKVSLANLPIFGGDTCPGYALIKALNRLEYLRSLNIDDSMEAAKDSSTSDLQNVLQSFAAVLTKAPKLEEFSMAGCHFSQQTYFRYILSGALSNPGMRKISMAYSQGGPEHSPGSAWSLTLASCIEAETSQLTHLRLAHCDGFFNSAEDVRCIIRNCKQMDVLDFSYCGLDASSGEVILKAPHLARKLNLNGNPRICSMSIHEQFASTIVCGSWIEVRLAGIDLHNWKRFIELLVTSNTSLQVRRLEIGASSTSLLESTSLEDLVQCSKLEFLRVNSAHRIVKNFVTEIDCDGIPAPSFESGGRSSGTGLLGYTWNGGKKSVLDICYSV